MGGVECDHAEYRHGTQAVDAVETDLPLAVRQPLLFLLSHVA